MSEKIFKKVFLIAGSEPLGSAGIQADIKSVSACGCYAAGAITTIVDEDTRHVKDVMALPISIIAGQCRSFLSDVGADCIKTGMLFSKEVITAVSDVVSEYPAVPLVVDSVMVSSNDDRLLQDDAIESYKELLFPKATIITPNRREAEILLGRNINPDKIQDDLKELSQWGNCVVVKSICKGETICDYFYNPKTDEMKVFTKPLVKSRNKNGTGDMFASSISAYIALGYELIDALQKAEEFISTTIENSKDYAFGDTASGIGALHPFLNK